MPGMKLWGRGHTSNRREQDAEKHQKAVGAAHDEDFQKACKFGKCSMKALLADCGEITALSVA